MHHSVAESSGQAQKMDSAETELHSVAHKVRITLVNIQSSLPPTREQPIPPRVRGRPVTEAARPAPGQHRKAARTMAKSHYYGRSRGTRVALPPPASGSTGQRAPCPRSGYAWHHAGSPASTTQVEALPPATKSKHTGRGLPYSVGLRIGCGVA